MTQLTQLKGKVVAVRGAVVDVAFEHAELPQLDEALVVEWDRPGACPPSALMRQIGWVEEGRISGSS